MPWIMHGSTLAYTAAGLFLLQLLYVIVRSKPHGEVWEAISVVGVRRKNSAISWFTATLKSIASMQDTMREGYVKYSKFDEPFALPTAWMGSALVVLPPSMLHLLNRPRDELSSFRALLDNAQFPYLMTDPDVWGSTFHLEAVRRNLGQKEMVPLASVIAAEWNAAFRNCWGDSDQGKVVNAWDSIARIIARVTLRFMVGIPGCRDERYLKVSQQYANTVLVDACFINCVPLALRPVLGRLIALRARYHQRRLLKILIPIVEERMLRIEEQKDSINNQDDVINWLVYAAKDRESEQITASNIAQRILALTSMFVFANTWVFAHALLDIYCSSSRQEIVSVLEAECNRVSIEHNGLSTKESVDNLLHLDSAIRESMRLNDVMIHLLPLDVVAGDGFEIGKGLRITRESKIRTVFPAKMVHMDPDIYQDPEHFNAFRFSRDDNEWQHENRQGSTRRQLMTTVSKTFLPFGYGRHACPGRWFVAQIVKQGIAHALLNYDIEVTKRPGKRTSLLNFMLPPERAEIRVTRKA